MSEEGDGRIHEYELSRRAGVRAFHAHRMLAWMVQEGWVERVLDEDEEPLDLDRVAGIEGDPEDVVEIDQWHFLLTEEGHRELCTKDLDLGVVRAPVAPPEEDDVPGTVALSAIAPSLALFDGETDERKYVFGEFFRVPRGQRARWIAEQYESGLRMRVLPEVQWRWAKYVWDRPRIESGLKLHREHGDSFEIPSDEDKQAVGVGSLVKLVWESRRSPRERMWVQVTQRDGDRLQGILDNDPLHQRLVAGETVRFHIDDVIDVLTEEEMAEVAADFLEGRATPPDGEGSAD